MYSKLEEYDEADVHYFCGKCRKRNPATTQDATKYLQEQMDTVDNRFVVDGLSKVFRDIKKFKPAWAFTGKCVIHAICRNCYVWPDLVPTYRWRCVLLCPHTRSVVCASPCHGTCYVFLFTIAIVLHYRRILR